MPSKLMLGSLPWLLQVMGAEGDLSCWGWCRVDIPGHRGAGGHIQGPSGVQSSRNRGAVRFGIASIPVSLQCQLLPPARASFGAWGPFASPFTWCQWSGGATLLLAWEWLQHCSCTPGRQEALPPRRAHSSTRSALHPQPPPQGSPLPPHPSPTQTPIHTPSPSPRTPRPRRRHRESHGHGTTSFLLSCNPALPSSSSPAR